ncbi:murein biosynthesis integral membrane protein MurJ [Paenalcaligenes hermetiae]|uniref:Probable lipid II flippase MurJ n=1 Tax=Paenalcaligenes hermetiae TaxID=1157987 RepID=A0ABP9LYL3_9BURK
MSLLRSAATISSLTFMSRITGLVRDILIARSFGAGPLSDAFWVAFRIPNLLRRLFAEGAFSQAFVPILGEVRSTGTDKDVRQLLDRVALALTSVLMLITALGMVAAPWVVSAMASGMTAVDKQTEFHAAIWMTRTMFPYILCMSLVALASGILNTWSRFAIPAFTPILLNISMILASVFAAPYFDPPIYALAVGVIIGGIAQLSVQWIALARLGLMPRYSFRVIQAWTDPLVKRVVKQMLPAILGVSVAQISLLINTNIATWLQAGSVTWLSFADRLMEFPTALLGVALGTVLLPKLSAAYAKKQHEQYQSLLDWGLRLVIMLGIPAALGLALLADGLVATLFHYGAFNAEDVAQTKLAVMAYAVGLLALLAIKILAPAFYARQDIKTPVRIAIMVLILTQLFNVIFVPRYAHAGLALSIGLGASINALCLLYLLHKRHIYHPQSGWLRFILRLIPALAVMTSILLVADHHIDWVALAHVPWQRALYLLLTVGICALSYGFMLILFGFRLRDFTKARP